jgi:hypothetical protein
MARSPEDRMQEMLRSNDLVLLSFAEAVLSGAGIDAFVADRHMAGLEGGIGALPRRLLVPAEDAMAARRHLVDAGLAAHLLADD